MMDWQDACTDLSRAQVRFHKDWVMAVREPSAVRSRQLAFARAREVCADAVYVVLRRRSLVWP